MNADSEQLRVVAPGIMRLRAPNPSAMTGSGTNTYLIDTGAGVVLIDPGPAVESHLAAILSALRPSSGLAAILISHAHLDHSELAPELARLTEAPMMAFGGCDDGRSPVMKRLVAAGMAGGGEGVDRAFSPDQRLADGVRLKFGRTEIEVLHSPGHMGGHLCFALGDTLFSGDHVMGWSTSLISPPDGDMADYMASLARLSARNWARFLPGHGAPVEQPAARLRDLAAHRHNRETAILAMMRPNGQSPAEIARQVYQDTPPALMPAATRNVLAHLIDLHDRNLITSDPFPESFARFPLI